MLEFLDGTPAALLFWMNGVKRLTDLRAWQTCVVYKRAVYRLVLDSPLVNDWKRRQQLEQSVAGPAAHIAEGYGRFNPPDFARFTVIARSSLMESQNHLIDAVDTGYITEDTRLELDELARVALEEVTGLMEYLQSPEALRNARRARERRIASREQRLAKRLPRTPNNEPEPEPRTPNPELRTPNPEPRTENPEPRTQNRTQNTNPEVRTEKRECL
jgi:four helix bundle protein